jgi:hypothetical protein
LQVLGEQVIGKSGVPGVLYPYANDCSMFIVQEHQRADKDAIFLILRLC